MLSIRGIVKNNTASPTPNTDNKGKLFVMLFAGISSHLPRSISNPKPGFAHLPALKYFIPRQFLASFKPIPRYCASGHLPIFYTRTQFRPLRKLIPRSRRNAIKLVPGFAKSTPFRTGEYFSSELRSEPVRNHNLPLLPGR